MADLIISCGGTGGHFYPGLSLARECLKQEISVRLYVAGKHVVKQRAEASKFEILSDEGRAIRLPQNKLGLPIFALVFGWTILQSIFHLLRRRPKAILFMGSFPRLL